MRRTAQAPSALGIGKEQSFSLSVNAACLYYLWRWAEAEWSLGLPMDRFVYGDP